MAGVLQQTARQATQALQHWLESKQSGKPLTREQQEQLALNQALQQQLAEPDGQNREPAQALGFRVSYVNEQSDPDVEWWETSLYWVLELQQGQIQLQSYENLATMAGAGQNSRVQLNSSDPFSEQNQTRSETWLRRLLAALDRTDVYIHCVHLRHKPT